MGVIGIFIKFISIIIKSSKFPFRVFCKIKNRMLFGHFGAKSRVYSPIRVLGYKNIYIGTSVMIHSHSWLQAVPLTGFFPKLLIGDNSTLGDFVHIVSTSLVKIGKNVLIANNVYISDNAHEYERINIPVKMQSIKQLRKVILGDGCWVGEHVSIIGASVGKNSIIGANSVVTHDIPDYCVAVGSPAYIIKRYNFTSHQWEKTDKKGKFLKL